MEINLEDVLGYSNIAPFGIEILHKREGVEVTTKSTILYEDFRKIYFDYLTKVGPKKD